MTDSDHSRQPLTGRCHIVGDDVNTDYIIAGRYKERADGMEGLGEHVFEDLDKTLVSRIKLGDFIVAGENFGSGSSRETASRALLAAGVRAVIARSFARIFFRNSINVGLPVIETDWHDIRDGDVVAIDTSTGVVRTVSGEERGRFHPLPDFLSKILDAGGVRELLASEREGS